MEVSGAVDAGVTAGFAGVKAEEGELTADSWDLV